MKIIDSNSIHQETIYSDICIIGAGPAGVTLASKLSDSGLDVILVESGGNTFNEKANELNTIRIDSNFKYRNNDSLRNRQIGGTANLWTGRVVPVRFDPLLDSEWGNLKEAVVSFYDDAFQFFGIDPRFPNTNKSLEAELVAYWAHKTERFNVESKILNQIKNIRICQFLTCIGFPELNNERIKALTFLNQKGERTKIHAGCFVFAMGGIENSRMLLVIRDQMYWKSIPSLKNVGKYVMDHPRIWHGHIIKKSSVMEAGKYQLNSSNFGIYKTGIRNQPDRARVYSNIMKSMSRVNILLNKISIQRFQASSKRLILREKGILRMLANEMAKAPIIEQIPFLQKPLRTFFNQNSSQSYRVMTYCEQRPRQENRINLSDAKDRNGVQIPKLTNNLHTGEITEVIRFFESFSEKISEMGGELEYSPDYLSDPANYTDASHIMGGTRFSNQKDKTVLEDDLSVVGIPNLFITGSSVFPTSSVENPTHLIVSLSCYLAEILKRKYS